MLRAERELEALIASAAAAKANLLKAVDLAGDYQLAPSIWRSFQNHRRN